VQGQVGAVGGLQGQPEHGRTVRGGGLQPGELFGLAQPVDQGLAVDAQLVGAALPGAVVGQEGAQRGDQVAVMAAVVFDQGAEDAADQLPGVFDAATGLAWAGPYVGDGVATSNLAGRILRNLTGQPKLKEIPDAFALGQAVPVVVRISVPARTALVTGVFSAISASFARWSSSTPRRVISRSIHRLFRSLTT